MKIYNIPELGLKWDNSKAVYPDIWCTTKPAVITVTSEWAKQNKNERRKRLVHEFLHLAGKEHNDKIGYSTYPDKDTYSMKVYKKLIGNPIVHCEKCKSPNTKLIGSKSSVDLSKGTQTQFKTYKCMKCGTEFKIMDRYYAYESSNPIHIKDYVPEERYIHKIDIWYDKHSKSWVVQKLDSHGFQMGNVDHVYSKSEAINLKKQYGKEVKNPILSNMLVGLATGIGSGLVSRNPKSLENYRLIASEYDLHMIKEIQKGLKSRGITSKIIIKRQPVGYNIYNLYSKY
jgi:hypothetical protein